MILDATDSTPAPPFGVGIATHRPLWPTCLVTLALVMILASVWALMHRYRGLTGDGELYAVQALARLQPGLAKDLYLAGGSQDRYTVFSPVYAAVIGVVGLRAAAMSLTALCTVWFLGAAWFLARRLSGRDTAWLAAAALVIIAGRYGAYGVFHFLEEWITARSVAEALVVTALAVHVGGRRFTALALGILALFVHPLMAFPGLLLLASLWIPVTYALAAAAAGVITALALALAPGVLPGSASVITVMDPVWLEVVRERSQFLFMQLWTLADWKLNARCFVSAALSAMVLTDPRVRRLCWCAMLVGATGLVIASIASTIGPVAILLQGQAWRWAWLTVFVAIMLLPQTLLALWKEPSCGPLCAVLLLGAWTFTPIDPLIGAGLALMLWTLRSQFSADMSRLLRWAAYALAAIGIAWAVANAWTILTSPSPESGRESLWLARVRNILGLDISAVVLVGALWAWIRRPRSPWIPGAVLAGFAALAAVALPGAFTQFDLVGAPHQIREFDGWRNVIPPTSNVFVIPEHNAATFAWFDLQRPSYISVDQSSGVVFSRATAMEVRRRSDVVLPVVDTGWRIQTKLLKQSTDKAAAAAIRPLTAASLVSICGDPVLDFVVAREMVGFNPLRHEQQGAWKDWYLYDCRAVRAARPAA